MEFLIFVIDLDAENGIWDWEYNWKISELKRSAGEKFSTKVSIRNNYYSSYRYSHYILGLVNNNTNRFHKDMNSKLDEVRK